MSYAVYLDSMLMPLTPERIVVRYRGRNGHVPLMDGGELTALRHGAGAEVSFRLVFPRVRYPFSQYERGFLEPEVFVNRLLAIRNERRAFRFVCSRLSKDGRLLADTNLRVSLEDLDVSECAEEGDDLVAEVRLREFREHTATRVAVNAEGVVFNTRNNLILGIRARETENAPQSLTHTVVRGDTLWGIARTFLGDGRRYVEIFELNRDQISNPHWIFPGQVLLLPPR